MADFFGPPGEKKPEKFSPSENTSPELQDFQPTGARGVQGKAHRLIKGHHPNAREIGERELVFSEVGSVLQLNTKINGVVKSLVFP